VISSSPPRPGSREALWQSIPPLVIRIPTDGQRRRALSEQWTHHAQRIFSAQRAYTRTAWTTSMGSRGLIQGRDDPHEPPHQPSARSAGSVEMAAEKGTSLRGPWATAVRATKVVVCWLVMVSVQPEVELTLARPVSDAARQASPGVTDQTGQSTDLEF
jgi:hypothetical protein